MQSQRQLRAGSVIQTAVMDIITAGKVIDEDLVDKYFYITKVQMSKDLKVANCYVRVYDSSTTNDKIIQALNKCTKIIRNILNTKIHLKYSPELRFFYDSGLDNHFIVDEISKLVI